MPYFRGGYVMAVLPVTEAGYCPNCNRFGDECICDDKSAALPLTEAESLLFDMREWLMANLRQPDWSGRLVCVECKSEAGVHHLSTCIGSQLVIRGLQHQEAAQARDGELLALRAALTEFVEWADDGEDDDGIVARGRAALASEPFTKAARALIESDRG